MKSMLMAIGAAMWALYALRSAPVDKLLGKQCSRQLRDPHV